MLDKRSKENELMDDLSLNEAELGKNLDELTNFNHWLGSKTVILTALDSVYTRYQRDLETKTILLGDLCCGGGDILRAIRRWAKSKKYSVTLMGIDANPFMIEYSHHHSSRFPDIQYQVLDIFSTEFNQLAFDIVTINSSCHHFSDDALVALLNQLKQQTQFAIIINDLHRHWMSYFIIKWFTRLFNYSYLAKHDAPLSVKRAFRKNELINLLKQAEITSYDIRWRWPFRWEIIIWLK